MSLEQTQRAIDSYFDKMGRAADFADCYTADVTWLTADTGELVQGPDSVRDYLNSLHSTMVDTQTRKLVVGQESVYLEGDCAGTPPETSSRIRYCIAYDMKGELIAAMRCYGPVVRSAS